MWLFLLLIILFHTVQSYQSINQSINLTVLSSYVTANSFSWNITLSINPINQPDNLSLNQYGLLYMLLPLSNSSTLYWDQYVARSNNQSIDQSIEPPVDGDQFMDMFLLNPYIIDRGFVSVNQSINQTNNQIINQTVSFYSINLLPSSSFQIVFTVIVCNQTISQSIERSIEQSNDGYDDKSLINLINQSIVSISSPIIDDSLQSITTINQCVLLPDPESDQALTFCQSMYESIDQSANHLIDSAFDPYLLDEQARGLYLFDRSRFDNDQSCSEQSISRSNNQTIDDMFDFYQTIDQSINQFIKPKICGNCLAIRNRWRCAQTFGTCIQQTITVPINQPINQSNIQSNNQSGDQPIDRSTNQVIRRGPCRWLCEEKNYRCQENEECSVYDELQCNQSKNQSINQSVSQLICLILLVIMIS